MNADCTALVTGGGGFLGHAIVKKLLAMGVKVRSFSRGCYPELEKAGVELRLGDLSDPKAVADASRGCDLIFHVAAKPGIWGPWEDYYQPNYVGTKNVLEACRLNKIPRLVYTSSPSVVFDGKDMENADESVPYPDHYEAHYPKTKAMAEKDVLAANNNSLSTVALRPHLIWGPEDNHLVPRIIKRGRAGQLKMIGDGKNKVDTVFIENAADAHLLAAEKLAPGAACAGKPYFISNGDPIPIADFINGILKAADLPQVTSTFPPFLAYFAGWAMEFGYGLFNIKDEPRLTRFLAKELATAHWFNISAAKRDFGYEPKISNAEGFLRLTAWLKTDEGKKL